MSKISHISVPKFEKTYGDEKMESFLCPVQADSKNEENVEK